MFPQNSEPPPMVPPAALFAHCPRCAALRTAGPVPVECAACGLCLFLNPAVAAAAFVFNGTGEALFLRRAHDPERGKLAVPGGFLDPGETAEDGLRRETREEVGLAIDHIQYVGSCPNEYHYRGVAYPVLDLVYRAVAIDSAQARPLDGAAAVEWRDVREVADADLAFPSLRMGRRLLAGA